MESVNNSVKIDRHACLAADAVMLSGGNLTSAERTRAAIRAYLMAVGQSTFAPYQLAAEAIAQETGQ